ncbi:MAG: hypothetical protein R3C17_17445 [Planctomycetaceae bacterium]
MNHKPNPLTISSGLPVSIALSALLAITLPPAPAGIADETVNPAATAGADEKKTPVDGETSETATPEGSESAAAPTAVSANVPESRDLLNQMRSALQDLDSLKCDLHETVILSGMKLQAVGTYAEAAGNRVRVEFRIFPSQAAGKGDAGQLALDADPVALAPDTSQGELTQVSDGTVLFTLMKNGANTRLTRRNLRDVMDAATKVAGYDSDHVAMDLGIGGLRGLISRIESLMEFAPAQTKKVGETEFYVVRGRWNAKTRTELFRLREDAVVDPRPHVPEYVVFYIDAKTLLPRRIEYRKRAPDPAQKLDRPLVTLDLRNLVLNESLPDDMFAFSAPEGVKEEDVTEQTIQAIQQSAATPDSTKDPAAQSPATETPATETPK